MAGQPQQPALSNPEDAFQRMIILLQAKDDTSRFVGLAMLKSFLDNQPELRDDPERIKTVWESLSPKFLDRLLRAGQNPKYQTPESRDLPGLAVAVLHTFAILLPAEARVERRFIGRAGPLVNTLVQSSPETTTLILQTLLTIVSQLEGALELLKTDDLSPLIEIAPQQPLALDILHYTWSNASTNPLESRNIIRQADEVVPKLLLSFKGTDAVTLLNFMGNTIPKLEFEIIQAPKWLRSLIQQLRNLVVSRPTTVGRSAYTILAAAMLQAFPTTGPQLLFEDGDTPGVDTKPFSYFFINLLLIDLRASFLSLLSLINDPSYPTTSQRLAAAFDTISAFIGHLVKSLDSDDNPSLNSLTMSPDLLLKLRKDIAETMSLTIEYLRDRYDASVAGAIGLHPSARESTTTTTAGTHLLTWDTKQESSNITTDTLILAGIRTLAIWLREDENEKLRNEAAALMDLFMDLYTSSTLSSHALDFRYPILTALEGILTTDDGISAFQDQNAWDILSKDLVTILQIATSTSLSTTNFISCTLATEIIRTLLLALDSPYFPSLTNSQLSALLTPISATRLPPSSTPLHPVISEYIVATLQLATALFLNMAPGVRRKFGRELGAVMGLCGVLEERGDLDAGLREEAEGLILGLEECR